MSLNPIKVLQAAIRAVPALKYALGVAGLVAVVAIVKGFRIEPQVAAFGAVVTLVLMVALVVFAKLTSANTKQFKRPVQVLMWSFLALTIATAVLLFSSAFFGWPMPFSGLRPGNGSSSSRQQVHDLLLEAEWRKELGDYASAWKRLQEAKGLQPQSLAVQTQQVQVALSWLRQGNVEKPLTWKEVADQLLPSLLKGAEREKGMLAGDIHAALGECYSIKFGTRPRRPEIEQEFKRASQEDPNNPYAHALWGEWIMATGGRIEDANAHFSQALKSGRDKPFVRKTQFSAMQNRWHEPAAAIEAIRVADQMRLSHETLSENERDRLAQWIYVTNGEGLLAQLETVLPPENHIATLMWFNDGLTMSDSIRFVLARLYEELGESLKAFACYVCLHDSDRREDEVRRGLARCLRRLPAGKSETQVLVEWTADEDPVLRESAIERLAAMGAPPGEILPALLAATRDPTDSVRSAAFEALQKLGAPAIPGAIDLLRCNDPIVLRKTADLLGEIGTNSPVAASALVKVLQVEDRDVRRDAIYAIGRIGAASAGAVEPLLALLQQEESLQDSIITALGWIGPKAEKAFPELLKLFDRYCEEAMSTGHFGDNTRTAALALKGMGHGVEVVPKLTVVLARADTYIQRSYAADALARLGIDAKAAIPALITALHAENESDRTDSAKALGKIAEELMQKGDRQAVPVLEKALAALQEGRFEPRLTAPIREALDSLKPRS